MVANHTLKAKARQYAENFGIPYPRALAELRAPGLGVPFLSKIDRERFGFDPSTDRNLILTGDFDKTADMLDRVFCRLLFRPGVEVFIIDLTGYVQQLSHLAADGSEGAASTPEAAIRVLSGLVYNATMADSEPGRDDVMNVLAINGLPELLRASPGCAELLSLLIKIASPTQSLVLAGDWIGSQPVPGGPDVGRERRLHFGPLPKLDGMPRAWTDLDPKDGEGIHHLRGRATEKFEYAMPASARTRQAVS